MARRLLHDKQVPEIRADKDIVCTKADLERMEGSPLSEIWALAQPELQAPPPQVLIDESTYYGSPVLIHRFYECAPVM